MPYAVRAFRTAASVVVDGVAYGRKWTLTSVLSADVRAASSAVGGVKPLLQVVSVSGAADPALKAFGVSNPHFNAAAEAAAVKVALDQAELAADQKALIDAVAE